MESKIIKKMNREGNLELLQKNIIFVSAMSHPMKYLLIAAVLLVASCTKQSTAPVLSTVTIHVTASNLVKGKQKLLKLNGLVTDNDVKYCTFHKLMWDSSFTKQVGHTITINVSGLDSAGNMIDSITVKLIVNGQENLIKSTKGQCTISSML